MYIDYKFMNTKVINDNESVRLFYETLKHELSHVDKYDAVIVGDDAALNFALDYRRELFDDIPIVFEGINDIETAKNAALDDNITGVVEEMSYQDNIDIAMKIMPNAENIVAIVDDTVTGKGERKQFYENVSAYHQFKFSEINASKYTKDEFIQQIDAIQENTIVIYLICSEDKDGNTYSSKEVTDILTSHSVVPVFRLVQSGIGEGLLGGNIVSHKESGKIAGEMVKQILEGTDCSAIEMVDKSPNMYYFDYSVMKKYDIGKNVIPKGSVLINEDVSFFSQHYKQIINAMIAVVLLLLVVIIVGFVLHIKQRNESLKKLETRNSQLTEAINMANHANSAKSQFLSRMSHEIRTPMNAILGITTITRKYMDNPKKVEENLEKIEISSKMLLGIINDVLDMSAIESDKIVIGHNGFDLKQFISSFNTMYFSLCHQKNIEFEVKLIGVTEEVLIGDQLRVNQIINNLLSNALKFTESGGTIQFIITQKYIKENVAYLSFSVSDSGCGMSDEMLGRLFKPFEQEDATTALHHGGSGLGMSITKNLVELMNGSISVKSTKGEGTTFEVSLPFDIPAHDDNENYRELSDIRVLAIDDDRETLEYLSTILERIGVGFDIADNGKDAILLFEKSKLENKIYDACMVDLRMPDMDGIEVTRRLREISNDTEIIIISAYDINSAEDEAKGAGADIFITKPIFQSTMFNILMAIRGKAYVSENADEEDYDFTGMKLLLVDDTEFNLDIAVELLMMVGFEVDCARNGKEAVEKYEASDNGYYSAILMDVQMPVMGGYEATKIIRQLDREDAGKIPIIAMTANAFTEDISASMAAGMNEHITKPIDTDTLYKTLKKTILD